jgi:dephospho-CoA kinase
MKNKRLIIGVTGGIATGKTTVLAELKRLGIPTIASDQLAHACLRRGHPVYRRVVQRYGRGILRSNGSVCREDLGKIVFAKPTERKWLERQIHPCVIQVLKSFIRNQRGIIALDIPLLFEAHLENLVDAILVVGASPRSQIKRLSRRNGLSLPEAQQRLRAQLPLSYKRKRADYYLSNEGTLSSLRKALRGVVDRIRKIA